VIREKKLGNDLAAILELLESHRAEIEGIAVESTFSAGDHPWFTSGAR